MDRREFIASSVLGGMVLFSWLKQPLNLSQQVPSKKQVKIPNRFENQIHQYYQNHQNEIDFWINEVFKLDDDKAFFFDIKNFNQVPYQGSLIVPNDDEVKEQGKKHFEKKGAEDIWYIRGRRSALEKCLSSTPKYYHWMREMFAPNDRNYFEQVEVPSELVFLPLSESLLNPRVVSSVGARGLWQFMESTGRRYGLTIDEFVDERWDIFESTQAAHAHFNDLFNLLEDWRLVLTGYIVGEQRIFGALEETLNLEKNYNYYFEKQLRAGEKQIKSFFDFHHTESRDETYQRLKQHYEKKDYFMSSQYVNLFVANYMVANYPGKFGFGDVEFQSPVPVRKVEVGEGLKTESLADYLQMDPDLLQELNSGLVYDFTPLSGDYKLRVPRDKSRKLAALPDEAKEGMRVNSIHYTVKPGDTITKIAERLEVSQENIILGENRSKDTIYPGERFTILLK